MSGSSNGSDKGRDHNDKSQDKNVIDFPAGKSRKRLEKKLHEERRDTARQERDQKKDQTALEDEYRKQYRAEQAKRAQLQSSLARRSASGKQPFINWDKIPPFARFMLGALLFVHAVMSFAVSPADHIYIMMHYGFVPSNYVDGGAGLLSLLVSPFTSLMLHGDWFHVLFNSVMLLAVGLFFEKTYGTRRAIIFFLLCGMAGHAMYFLLNPFSTVPVVGASGAISGLFAVTVILMSESGMMGPEAQKRGPTQFILLWVVVIIAFGFMGQGVAWQSHLGGFLGGIAFFHLWKRGVLKF